MILHLLLFLGGLSPLLGSMNLPPQTQQVVLVTTQTWSSPTGTMQTFSRHRGQWVLVGAPVAVNVGSRGLGWGRGLHFDVAEAPQKNEGDNRGPAGIFTLGPAFGYAANAPQGTRSPYRRLGDGDFWVTDSRSRQYNQLVSLSGKKALHPERVWSSYEKMKRGDGLYELGIVVDYNTNPAAPGRGSAIFLHVERGPGMPTSGCTSMPKATLQWLMSWLDPAKKPLLIQAPVQELKKIRFVN
jgi:L,D-peptidoglycan transpeptidase YkuD (ErfK/YbiS/YcfS/YnhG family)